MCRDSFTFYYKLYIIVAVFYATVLKLKFPFQFFMVLQLGIDLFQSDTIISSCVQYHHVTGCLHLFVVSISTRTGWPICESSCVPSSMPGTCLASLYWLHTGIWGYVQQSVARSSTYYQGQVRSQGWYMVIKVV